MKVIVLILAFLPSLAAQAKVQENWSEDPRPFAPIPHEMRMSHLKLDPQSVWKITDDGGITAEVKVQGNTGATDLILHLEIKILPDEKGNPSIFFVYSIEGSDFDFDQVLDLAKHLKGLMVPMGESAFDLDWNKIPPSISLGNARLTLVNIYSVERLLQLLSGLKDRPKLTDVACDLAEKKINAEEAARIMDAISYAELALLQSGLRDDNTSAKSLALAIGYSIISGIERSPTQYATTSLAQASHTISKSLHIRPVSSLLHLELVPYEFYTTAAIALPAVFGSDPRTRPSSQLISEAGEPFPRMQREITQEILHRSFHDRAHGGSNSGGGNTRSRSR